MDTGQYTASGLNPGSLPIYGINFIPSDENEPCTFLILTDPDSSFVCAGVGETQVTSFGALSDGVYVQGTIESDATEQSCITLTMK